MRLLWRRNAKGVEELRKSRWSTFPPERGSFFSGVARVQIGRTAASKRVVRCVYVRVVLSLLNHNYSNFLANSHHTFEFISSRALAQAAPTL